MFPQQVELNESNIRKLTTLYQSAYAQMAAEITNASSFGVAHRRALMAQIRQILTELGNESLAILEKDIEKQYETGAKEAVDQLKQVDADIPVTQGFNRIHKEAITALVDDTQTAFAESIQGVNRSVRSLLTRTLKEQLTQQMAYGKLSGQPLRNTKAILTDLLQNEGFSALKDKAGRTWTLDRYTEMLIRTKGVEARNRGLANRVAENGYDLVQVSSHGAKDNCGPWEGKILSTTGQTPGYPLVREAEAAGLFHPNCRHAINVIVPELAKLTNAYLPDSPTMSGEEFYAKYYQ